MKITFAAIRLLLLLAMANGIATASAAVRVVTSFYPVYVAALNVTDGIEGTEVHNLARPHIGCLPDYNPVSYTPMTLPTNRKA